MSAFAEGDWATPLETLATPWWDELLSEEETTEVATEVVDRLPY